MKKLSDRGFSIVEMLIVLVVFGAIAGAGWYVWKQNQNKSSTSNTSNLSIKEIGAQVKTRVSSDVPEVKEEENAEGGFNVTISYKLEGYDYLTTAEANTSIVYAPRDSAYQKTQAESEEAAARQKDNETLAPAKTIIDEILQENNFIEVKDYPADTIFGEGGGKLFERDGDVCAVLTDLVVGLGCVAKSDLRKEAEKVKPFIAAIRKGDPSSQAEGTSYSLLETGTGRTPADKYAIVSTNVAAAYLYQDNDEWVFIASSQEGIGCDEDVLIRNPKARDALIEKCRKPGEGL